MMHQILPEGRLLSTAENQALLASPEGLHAAMEGQIVLESVALRCDRGHNLHLRLGEVDAIIPHDECAVGLDDGTTREIALLTRVGKPVAFLVTGLVGEDGRIVARLSRRLAQEQALEVLLNLPAGAVLPATVTRLEPFGAFVDIGRGIPSMIPLGAISVARISHPADRFETGQEIFAVLHETIPRQRRLLLSHKELLGTWAENAARFTPGETVTGIVRGVLDYGIFVELAPNLPGLAEYLPGYAVGDRVSVYIKAILPERQKIKLLLIDRLPGPARCAPPNYFVTGGNVAGWDYHAPDA
ncbi:MAG: S1 RNA-binding domain-containing protein [Clostridiales bacterium]|nr:S1 RNA-binding domain-containing protein [Clostridiales bacterium]